MYVRWRTFEGFGPEGMRVGGWLEQQAWRYFFARPKSVPGLAARAAGLTRSSIHVRSRYRVNIGAPGSTPGF